jgi:hypothetical protein
MRFLRQFLPLFFCLGVVFSIRRQYQNRAKITEFSQKIQANTCFVVFRIRRRRILNTFRRILNTTKHILAIQNDPFGQFKSLLYLCNRFAGGSKFFGNNIKKKK